jgi:hypothetical protein
MDSKMKTTRLITTSLFLLLAVQSVAFAQSVNITETFKKHFNETVQQVQQTENADEKRLILNESFTKMIIAIDRVDSLANLSEDQIAQLHSYKLGIVEKQNELNGLDGFDEVLDEDLDDFSDYSQQAIEQANKTITVSVITVILVIIILLLI